MSLCIRNVSLKLNVPIVTVNNDIVTSSAPSHIFHAETGRITYVSGLFWSPAQRASALGQRMGAHLCTAACRIVNPMSTHSE